jgi:MFS family permease
VRRIFLRSALFIVPAMALWALLPLVATERLGMGAGGYGLLLAALGVGAVAGAFTLPRLSARLSSNRQLIAASALYTVVLVVLVAMRNVTAVVVALILVGLAWIAVLSCINAALQLFLPVWVRARGLAVYLMVLFGGQALGALLWGLIAQRVGLVATFIAAAAAMTVGAATIRRWPLLDTRGEDRSPAVYWPEPHLVFEPEPERGPVIITVSYTVSAANESRFLDAMRLVRHSRLRTGATRWGLYRDGEMPHRFVEIYAMPSWDEHLRQHRGRLTGTDRAFEEQARALAESPPEVAHLFAAEAARPP